MTYFDWTRRSSQTSIKNYKNIGLNVMILSKNGDYLAYAGTVAVSQVAKLIIGNGFWSD